VTAVLLGVLWTAVFMVAWASRDRAEAEPEAVSRQVEPAAGR
jgi:hypothetical protein